MKKITICACIIISFILMVGCYGQVAVISSTMPDSTADQPVQADPKSLAEASQVQYHTEVFEFEESAVVEYISVTGMPDAEVQNKLNENLEDFYLWQWRYRAPDVEDDSYYMGTATYSVIGDKYLSVLRILGTYNDEHSVNGSTGAANENASAMVFDLTTGEPAEGLVFGGGAYKMGAAADSFSQVYPDRDDPAAKEKFNEYMESNEFVSNYILTEYMLGVFIENEEGDGFYRFDALYSDIPQMMSAELAQVLSPGLSIRKETLTQGRGTFEYLVVTGMSDVKIQEALNEDLKIFSTWALVNIEKPVRNIAVTTEYALVGGKYLSVRSYETEYIEGSLEPVKRIKSKLYDMDTGEYAGWTKDFIKIDSELDTAFKSGVFVQVHPETPVEGAADIVAAAITADDPLTYNTGFYLTESSLGLYLQDNTEDSEDYLAFEAEYNDIKSLVLPGVTAELIQK